MLRLIQVGQSLPFSFPVDFTAEFQSGMIAELKLLGNEIVVGVSSGLAPLGILDDENTSAFSESVQDEIIVIHSPGAPTTDGYGNFFMPADTKQELRNTNIIRSSFVVDVPDLVLNEKNGVLLAPEGTQLNYDSDGDGIFDAIKAFANYAYQIVSIPGDNTTLASGRATVWFQRGIFETDQYDTTARYYINSTLFVSPEGMLTSTRETEQHPGVALVTGPPTPSVSTLQFLWL